MTPINPVPVRPTIRHRRTVRQPNRFVGPIIIMVLTALVLQMFWMQRNWGEITRRGDYTEFDAELLDKLKSKIIHLYECEYCVGNGSLPDPDDPAERVMCEICHGVGYHATRRYTDDDRMCLACGGMGRRYSDSGQATLCIRCDGRGIVQFQD